MCLLSVTNSVKDLLHCAHLLDPAHSHSLQLTRIVKLKKTYSRNVQYVKMIQRQEQPVSSHTKNQDVCKINTMGGSQVPL